MPHPLRQRPEVRLVTSIDFFTGNSFPAYIAGLKAKEWC